MKFSMHIIANRLNMSSPIRVVIKISKTNYDIKMIYKSNTCTIIKMYMLETHTDTKRGGELVSRTFGYFSHYHRLTKLTE